MFCIGFYRENGLVYQFHFWSIWPSNHPWMLCPEAHKYRYECLFKITSLYSNLWHSKPHSIYGNSLTNGSHSFQPIQHPNFFSCFPPSFFFQIKIDEKSNKLHRTVGALKRTSTRKDNFFSQDLMCRCRCRSPVVRPPALYSRIPCRPHLSSSSAYFFFSPLAVPFPTPLFLSTH